MESKLRKAVVQVLDAVNAKYDDEIVQAAVLLLADAVREDILSTMAAFMRAKGINMDDEIYKELIKLELEARRETGKGI